MARPVSIVRAPDAPHFVVYLEDQVLGRFGSLDSAFEVAHAAGAEISDNERSCVESWLLGAQVAVGEAGPPWLREVVSLGSRGDPAWSHVRSKMIH